jgi:hypothetical protein
MAADLKERRRHTRVDTVNLVHYELFDISGQKTGEGKGRTINLSQSGTMLETDRELVGPFVLLMTIDLNGAQIKLQGWVAHSSYNEASERFLTGIEFMDPEYRQQEAIAAFIKNQEHREVSGGS